MKKEKLNLLLKLIFFLSLLICIVIFYQKINYYYLNTEELIKSSGAYGPLVYMFLMIFAILIAPIPSSPLVFMAGSVFGIWAGLLYTLIGATIGAMLAFTVARFFLKDFLESKFVKSSFYQSLNKNNDKKILRVIFLTRLMPHISFDLVSYFAGLTSVKLTAFAFVTFLGMVPIVFIETFFGSILKEYVLIILTAFLVFMIGYYVKNLFLGNRNKNISEQTR